MERLEKQELLDCSGGGISFGLGLAIAGAIVFIIGVIDGYIRPLACH